MDTAQITFMFGALLVLRLAAAAEVCTEALSEGDMCTTVSRKDVRAEGVLGMLRILWSRAWVKLLLTLLAIFYGVHFLLRWNSSRPGNEIVVARAPAQENLPLLMYISTKALQKANQGLEWSMQRLITDEDGDRAHAFLGPFSFAQRKERKMGK
mmetsp:Transcript_164/g.424  ORF Transcript_164/g.424 Transcript_164/m.424 type:complete len:154 (-) Transcript_164:290-751(-)